MKNKLCFTSSLNEKFIPGAIGLINSIRKFYSPAQADIIIFIDQANAGFTLFCIKHKVQLHLFESIQPWILKKIYSLDRYKNDKTHYYHPLFTPHAKVSFHVDHLRDIGFHRIHHLHPLNVKAYCTGYCILIKDYLRVIHIDSDAFLLAPIDEIFIKYSDIDSITVFEDVVDNLDNLEYLYGAKKNANWNKRTYGFNAGIVFYVNGPGVKSLIMDFCFYIDSCYHYDKSGFIADQGVLRALVAAYDMNGKVKCNCLPAANWNPLNNSADDLEFEPNGEFWINRKTTEKQRIFHAAGRPKVWSGLYPSLSVKAAWNWVNGEAVDNMYMVWRPFCEDDFLNISEKLNKAISIVTSTVYKYDRVGYDHRLMTFLINGRIDKGKAGMEQFWNMCEESGKFCLDIHSGGVKTCRLYYTDDGWTGYWNYFEKMPIKLTAVKSISQMD